MKSLTVILSLFLFLLTSPLPADDKNITAEKFGKLSLGQKADALIKLLGEPESKEKDTLWEATGEWVQTWNYPAKGLALAMASNKKGGSKTLSSITANSKCELATAREIKLGSTEAAVRKAYAKTEDKESSQPGETFIAGSIYGGVMFTFKHGKVSEIFIGAAAE
jgi:expansin (peptidoglycan-binding protein)